MKALLVPVSDVNSETAVVTTWHVEDRACVRPGELVAVVETSKAVVDVEADDAGHLLRCARAGEEFRLDAPLAYVFPTAEALRAYADARAAEPEPRPGRRATAPALRRAAELGVEIATLPGDGLVTVRLVEAAAPAAELPEPLEASAGAQRIVLIGAGLGATQVLDILRGDQVAVAIVDDDRSRWGAAVAGVPVVGGGERLAAYDFDAAIITISTSVPARTRFRERCAALGLPLANAIDPTARLGAGVRLGAGNVVCAFCHLGVGTRVGDNNFLSAYNSFDHHNELGSDISTGPGCMTSGLVRIGDHVRLGTGIFVEPHVEIGAGAHVASGAVIVAPVPAWHAVKRRTTTTVTVPIRG